MSRINIQSLSVTLQENTILSKVNLTLAKGDILGLVGPSGCGKTTLLNVIAGFIELSQGEIQLDDDGKLTTISPEFFIPPEQRNIGMIFQDYALFPHLSVAKNICFGIAKQSKLAQQSQLIKLLKLLKLEELANRYPHQLSGGQQQRVAIARALAPKPTLLLLDEPFSNIDARLRNELITELRLLLKTLNITAIFVTHNKDEVFSFADKIAVMAQGEILQTGKPTDVCQQPNSWQVADFLQLGSWLPVTALSEDSLLGSSLFGDNLFEESLLEENLLEENLTNNKQPIKRNYQSALGLIEDVSINKSTATFQRSPDSNKRLLLIKPQYITLCPESDANVYVEHISMTEQGFHYLLSSLDTASELAFSRLSFYSHEPLNLGEKLAIKIKDHQSIIFAHNY